MYTKLKVPDTIQELKTPEEILIRAGTSTTKMQEILIHLTTVMPQTIAEISRRQKTVTIITLKLKKRTSKENLTPSMGEFYLGLTSHSIAQAQAPAHGTGTRWILPIIVTNEAATIVGNTTIARILVGLTTD